MNAYSVRVRGGGRRNDQAGAALILVLLMISILVVMAVETLRAMQVEEAGARYFQDSFQAEALAKWGVHVTMVLLLRDGETNQAITWESRGPRSASRVPKGSLSVRSGQWKARWPTSQAVEKDGPDLILCNIKMPGKTGLETLAICKNIIEAHHGDIYLKNEVGVGTTVSIWLPLAQAAPSAQR